jgi:hypothetical protein
MTERLKEVIYKNKVIITINLSRATPEEVFTIIHEAIALISKRPPKSCLVLTDVSEATYNKQVADAIKDFVQKNTPFIKASAVVGADGVRHVLLQTVIFLSRRELKSCNNREEALNWLVEHG